jgi:hypothetical protein
VVRNVVKQEYLNIFKKKRLTRFGIICHNSMLFLLKTISNYKIDGIYRQSQQYVGYIVAVSSFRCRKQRAQGENT